MNKKSINKNDSQKVYIKLGELLTCIFIWNDNYYDNKIINNINNSVILKNVFNSWINEINKYFQTCIC